MSKEEAKELTLHERLLKAGAIDLRDNMTIEDVGDGYVLVEPIDPTKLYK